MITLEEIKRRILDPEDDMWITKEEALDMALFLFPLGLVNICWAGGTVTIPCIDTLFLLQEDKE